MNHEPDVSIVVACYNRELFISEAINSALGQEGAKIEVVVVDDGSSDRSTSIMQDFGEKIVMIRKRNSGVSAARNEGVRRARGKYIKFLDSDDIMAPNAIGNLLMESLKQHDGCKIIFGDAASIDVNGLRSTGPSYGYSDVPPGTSLTWSTLLSGTLSPWLPLFPRHALITCGGFNEQMHLGEDQELAIRLKKQGYKFVRKASIVALVREHDGPRLSRGVNAARHARQLFFFEQVAAQLQNVKPPLSAHDWNILGRLAWIRGRDAARDGLRDSADDLFAFALQVGDKSVRSNRLSPLYAIMPPYDAERFMGRIKRWLK